MQQRREFANSANGDRWLLARDDDTDNVLVEHYANPSSGGSITKMNIAKFLGSGPMHPQHLALLALIGTLVDEKAADADSQGLPPFINS